MSSTACGLVNDAKLLSTCRNFSRICIENLLGTSLLACTSMCKLLLSWQTAALTAGIFRTVHVHTTIKSALLQKCWAPPCSCGMLSSLMLCHCSFFPREISMQAIGFPLASFPLKNSGGLHCCLLCGWSSTAWLVTSWYNKHNASSTWCEWRSVISACSCYEISRNM